jgi:hypothetical protein
MLAGTIAFTGIKYVAAFSGYQRNTKTIPLRVYKGASHVFQEDQRRRFEADLKASKHH